MATEITELIQIPPNKKVVIDFYATWCGPCARVTPIIDELAEKYEDIKFLKVNVDQADEIAEGFEIGSLPTFVYLNLGNIVHRIEGADLNNILRSIEKLDQIVNPDNENDDNNDENVIEEPVISEVKKEERREERREEGRRVKREVRREQITESNIEPKKEERKESKSNRREPREERRVEKREETREERIQRKRLEMGLIEKEADEEKPSKKIEMKIAEKKSRELEKKKSKKKSSKESQKKAERRNFNDVNPYEIEYNNDTPEISSDSDDISVSS